MENFNYKIKDFYKGLGSGKNMVLSTLHNNRVSSRMMSIVLINGIFYFQTDKTFRKYEQIKNNPNIALCIDNIQIEGICLEVGHPLSNNEFCRIFEKCFKGSYDTYSALKNERLFKVKPTYIEKWEYKNGKPFIEIIDIENKVYKNMLYEGN
ncbi:pyridoxamine 5'-phosphate oxidase family protein [Clostridium sp. AL.422]|uniref:pyridoxamine 5'-phosphate oxidase family protein n=1 Tax=Clostridium TaxID=1485 RepID=UPI00293DCB54|nr:MULTISPECIES: pyridoxamine 5'-phosphate oxidase family protein [unclassified Clostridium]MDV4149786.1 pyridoxamine 5'-phosphate oxidase family protein [Clostridium sp. AL.422]